MSNIDTSTWNPDPALNESIGDIPLNETASIRQTWQAIQMLMAAGGLHGLQLVPFTGATSQEDGTQGLVPAPSAGDESKVLQGGGTWGTVAAADHVHGNISNAGAIGSTSGLPIVTGTNGILLAGSFGNAAGTVCEGNDSRLSDARTPTSHTHGNVANDGKLGTASRVVVTDSDKLVDVSSVTAAELGYLSGVTSAVQTQLDAKAADSGVVHLAGSEELTGTKTFRSDILIINGYALRSSAASGFLKIQGGTSDTTGARVVLSGASRTTHAGEVEIVARDASASAALVGKPDGTLTWNGSAIQTSSDERLKTSLGAVPDEVLDAWEAVQWGQFRFLDAVKRKGGSARLHLGLIAQRVKAAFEARGLDACAYGILCYEEEEDVWMVRYEEALAMEACCQRRRADRLQARIAALEEAMNA